jgi:hypothetical protein
MTERWKDDILQIIDTANALKQSAMNRHDARFPGWHRQTRDCIQNLAPKKLPAFDEIRFASDFFLSKPEDTQTEINDRIALVSDLDLCIEMMNQIMETAEEAQQKAKARRQAGIPTAPQGQTPQPNTPPPSGDLREVVTGLDLSARDKEEVLAEIERVERALAKPQPDWDQIKRVIRFLLDFDRNLAVEAIPLILARIPKS